MFWERIKKYKPEQVVAKSTKSDSIFDVSFVRHGATPFKHIIRRSFLRPRDIIVYMNKIHGAHDINKKDFYSSKDIYNAEKDYSISMYNEILDEWSNQMPEISDLLGVLQNIKYQTFTYDDFEQKYISTFPGKEGLMKKHLNFLFHNSIVGQKISANWEYQCGNPYMNIDYNKLFHVNSALKSRLMLTEGRA